nr:proline-rich protein 36-like [Coffea arabica]
MHDRTPHAAAPRCPPLERSSPTPQPQDRPPPIAPPLLNPPQRPKRAPRELQLPSRAASRSAQLPPARLSPAAASSSGAARIPRSTPAQPSAQQRAFLLCAQAQQPSSRSRTSEQQLQSRPAETARADCPLARDLKPSSSAPLSAASVQSSSAARHIARPSAACRTPSQPPAARAREPAEPAAQTTSAPYFTKPTAYSKPPVISF